MLAQVDWNLLFARNTRLFWDLSASCQCQCGDGAFGIGDSIGLVWSDGPAPGDRPAACGGLASG